MIFEDIVSNIVSNGGHVLDVQMQDVSATITYVDSSGTKHVDNYVVVVNDDGSEDWNKVS